MSQEKTSTREVFFAHQRALVESGDIGLGTRIWAFAHVMAGARIGADCNIGDHAFIETGAVLGNNVTVKNGVAIWAGVEVEDNVFLGPNCVFTNDLNPRAFVKKLPEELEKTFIRANATVGANATVLCGITVGRYAFIGAGAVVLRSVPDFGLLVGNPGKQIGWMCICAHRLPMTTRVRLNMRYECSTCRRSFVAGRTGLQEWKSSEG